MEPEDAGARHPCLPRQMAFLGGAAIPVDQRNAQEAEHGGHPRRRCLLLFIQREDRQQDIQEQHGWRPLPRDGQRHGTERHLGLAQLLLVLQQLDIRPEHEGDPQGSRQHLRGHINGYRHLRLYPRHHDGHPACHRTPCRPRQQDLHPRRAIRGQGRRQATARHLYSEQEENNDTIRQ